VDTLKKLNKGRKDFIHSNETISYWGGADLIDVKEGKVRNLFLDQYTNKGISSAVALNDNLYLGSWGDQSVSFCRKKNQTS